MQTSKTHVKVKTSSGGQGAQQKVQHLIGSPRESKEAVSSRQQPGAQGLSGHKSVERIQPPATRTGSQGALNAVAGSIGGLKQLVHSAQKLQPAQSSTQVLRLKNVEQKLQNVSRGTRSPYQDTKSSAELNAGRHANSMSNVQGEPSNFTPTTESRLHTNLVSTFSNKNFSMRQSQESVQSSGGKQPVSGGKPSSKTQRLMQKSTESRDGRKNLEIISSKSRERQLWQPQNNHTPVTQDPKITATSKTYRHQLESLNQFRMSTESHVSGISGILGNTQLTTNMGASGISVANAGGTNQRQPVNQNDSLTDEIFIGCQVLQQPKHGHQHLLQNLEASTSGFLYPATLAGSSGQQQKHQQSVILKQRSNISNTSFYDNLKSPYIMNSGSHMNQSQFSNQLQLINSNLQNKVCNNIEEAQPILRLCLTNVGISNQMSLQASQFTSLLSDNDIDQNLVCPSCKFLVVRPVECKDCQYIICYKCAELGGMRCLDKDCGEPFTRQPGKIHKLYKTMLNQLEFRCPNHMAGCQELLKYEHLDEHLQNGCECRDRFCPNACGKEQKFCEQALKEHLELHCPRELCKCPDCKRKFLRMDLHNHLENECEMSKMKCDKCELTDTRASFKSGKHDCISLLKTAYKEIQITTERESDNPTSTRRLRSGDQRPRNYEDYSRQAKPKELDSEVVLKQVSNMKRMLQNLENLVNEDIFRMLDNMSLCVTQKDNEVQELTQRTERLEGVTEALQKKLKTQTKDYEGMLAILDLKLGEKIQEIKKNQEQEISNIKRMMMNQIDTDLPLQIEQTHSASKEGQLGPAPPEERKTSLYNPIRGPKSNAKVPPINFQAKNHAQAAQDIEQDNYQTGQHSQQISSRKSSKISVHKPSSRGGQKRPNTELEEVISDENEDFQPFLSSTENEYTDLNTDFNTDRMACESSGPQSTYRNPNSKSRQKEKPNQDPGILQQVNQGPPGQQEEQHQELMPKISVYIDRNEELKDEPLNPEAVEVLRGAASPAEQPNLEHQQQDESCPHEEDMSFDNESYQNNSAGPEPADPEDNQVILHEQPNEDIHIVDEIQQRGNVDQSCSNDSFNNNDDDQEEDLLLDEGSSRNRRHAPGTTVTGHRAEGPVEAGPGRGGPQERESQGESLPVSSPKPTEQRAQLHHENPNDSFNPKDDSNQLISILDESSDIEQLQNDQLPGSIHGGNTNSQLHANNNSMSSQGQFSALSRGQLFNRDPIVSNCQSNNNSCFSLGLANGQSSDRQLCLDSLEGINAEHMQSLESLESVQINLERNMHETKKSFNQYKQQKSTDSEETRRRLTAAAQLDRERAQYQQKLREALDLEQLQPGNAEALKDIMYRGGGPEKKQDQLENTAEEDQELIENIKSETFDMIQSIKNNHQNELIRITQNNLPNESYGEQVETEDEHAQIMHGGRRNPGLDTSLPSNQSSDYEKAALHYQHEYDHMLDLQNQIMISDQEEGNETENEVIRDHLQAIIEAHPRQAHAISALKGLESDLETIFETDLESNYITTARTNLSTKKLLQQVNNLHAHGNELTSQERMNRILTSQFSPIAHSGSVTTHHSHSKQTAAQSIKDYSSVPVQNPQKGPKPSLQGKLNLKMIDASEHISPGNNTTGQDTSQSALISNRSSKAQPVKSSAAVALHPSGSAGSANLLSPTSLTNQNKQCFFTHQELEQMGRSIKAPSQSQLDLEERRIRVYHGGTSGQPQKQASQAAAEELRAQQLYHQSRHSSSRKRRGNRKSITQPEIIQEAECEEDDQDQSDQHEEPTREKAAGRSGGEDGTTVEILQGIRQNLKEKFERSQGS